MANGRGVWTELFNGAESHLQRQGYVLLEVTSAERRADAHAFYLERGHRDKRVCFVKNPAE